MQCPDRGMLADGKDSFPADTADGTRPRRGGGNGNLAFHRSPVPADGCILCDRTMRRRREYMGMAAHIMHRTEKMYHLCRAVHGCACQRRLRMSGRKTDAQVHGCARQWREGGPYED